jgi:cytochrome c peroxidase
LRNVADRAPYMHDGSIGTLVGVVEHYRNGIVQRPTLSPDLPRIDVLSDRDIADLVAFLHTLSPDPATAADSLTASAPSASAAADTLTIIQKDKRFSERHVHIQVGQALTIENQDTRAHNIQVFDENLEFNSGYQEPGEHVSLPFTQAGTYHVFCGIHPKMKLQVDVK